MAKKSSMSLFLYLNPLAFFVSFGLGILVVYTIVPPHRVVIKFPNPHNSGKVTYKGDDNNCYTYKSEEIACPLNEPERIRMQPV